MRDALRAKSSTDHSSLTVGALSVDPDLETPPFEQLKRQIIAARATGAYPAGHRLPPVRQLAADVALAANTVARAYRELEAEGVIETRGRAGSFVTGTAEGVERAAAAATRDFLAVIGRLGLTLDDALRLISEEGQSSHT